MFKYNFGIEGRFELDVTYSTWGLDQEALLKLKEKPAKLNGRVYKVALSDSCGRKVDAWHERVRMKLAIQNNLVSYDDVIDDEPNLVGEHLAAKALNRKHRASQRYRKVRQEYATPGHFDLRSFKKEARRRRRRQLNDKAIAVEKDVVRKYRSTFSDAEPYSIKGMKLLDGHISGFGSFDL